MNKIEWSADGIEWHEAGSSFVGVYIPEEARYVRFTFEHLDRQVVGEVG